MKSLLILAVLVAACAAGAVRDKRWSSGGWNSGWNSGWNGGWNSGWNSGWDSAPATRVVAVNKVVNVQREVSVPQVINVRKIISEPQVITVKKVVPVSTGGWW